MKSLWWKRVSWLVFIWASSVAALAIVAFFVRLLMTSAGLKV